MVFQNNVNVKKFIKINKYPAIKTGYLRKTKIKFKNYLTSSLNFLPAENAGTVFAAILISLPV